MIIRVLVLRPVQTFYFYHVNDEVKIGQHVVVPFSLGRAKGVIVEILNADTPDFETTLKYIESVDLKKPIVSQNLLNLIDWFIDFYQVTPFLAYQTVFGKRSLRKDIYPIPEYDYSYKEPDLSEEQLRAFQKILLKEHRQYYLHGVTGSGKTELYLRLTKEMMSSLKSVIILVPEIALTPQFTSIFKQRIGDRVAIIHSQLTSKQRSLEWNYIYSGYKTVVIGPRSAIFSPVKDLGLIIIDEEHENSYKQDNQPRYHTHDIANFRSKNENALLIYGSATPSINLFYEMNKNPSQIIFLRRRIFNRPLPRIEYLSQLEQRFVGGGIFLEKTFELIQKTVSKKEKVMILVNRKGYSSLIICNKCNYMSRCDHCKLGLTYHYPNQLHCHRCHIEYIFTRLCPSCNKGFLALAGIGTQKVEFELKSLLHTASILRLDKDVASTSRQLESILNQFKGTGDILIGTNLIAKGHDIPEVTLVVVLGIDQTLNIPDYRSPENTFQLLTQVSGRAGRGEKSGLVLVQVQNFDHYVLKTAASQNYEHFYHEELSFREELRYPPFSRLIVIFMSSEDKETLIAFCKKIKIEFLASFKEAFPFVPFIGPTPAPIEKIRTFHRYYLVFKCSNTDYCAIKEKIKFFPKSSSKLRIIKDFDPIRII